MTNEKRKYCMETIIPDLKNAGVTLEQLSEELDYRAKIEVANITKNA